MHLIMCVHMHVYVCVYVTFSFYVYNPSCSTFYDKCSIKIYLYFSALQIYLNSLLQIQNLNVEKDQKFKF
jgi:hypothetical protein